MKCPSTPRARTKRLPTIRPERIYKDATETSPENWVAEAEASFNATGNPIYVWEAIARLNFHRLNVAIESTEWERGTPLPRLQLPEWCVNYLMSVALKVGYLGRGLDERLRPTSAGSRTDNDRAQAEWYSKPTLTARTAMSRLAEAFSFARQGWNAFADLWRGERALQMEADRLRLRDEGVTTQQANEQVMAAWGIDDERQFRRMMSDAKRHQVGIRRKP